MTRIRAFGFAVALASLWAAAPAAAVFVPGVPIEVGGLVYVTDYEENEDFRTVTIIVGGNFVFGFDQFFIYDFDQDTPGLQGPDQTGNDFSDPTNSFPGSFDLNETLGIVRGADYTPYGLIPDRMEVTFDTAPDEIVSNAIVRGNSGGTVGVLFSGVDTNGSPVSVLYEDNTGQFFAFDSAFLQNGSPSGLVRVDSILAYGTETNFDAIDTVVAVAPEPATAGLVALGLATLTRRRRRA